MNALQPDVFREALVVQDAIIGTGFGPSLKTAQSVTGTQLYDGIRPNPSSSVCTQSMHGNMYWGFHSPLMYWNCSSESLEVDKDVLGTINSRSAARSFLNFTLRPSSLFAGKTFYRDKIVAADALVITFFDRMGFHVQDEWDVRSKALAEGAGSRWSIYPSDGKASRSQLYEFRFQPMSLHDDLGLALAYGLMALYVIASLRKVRAVKSKVGLIITIVAQIAITFLASFTICAMIPSINLTQIPREMYPFVALVLGLENMFRLVNSVLAYPPEMPTTQRIGKALGQVGHLSLAAAAQNMVLLGLLSRAVSPGVAAFCTFAAVAIVIDFVFHLTFFTAVLSVDVRRMELQESLDKINMARRFSKPSHEARSSTDQLWSILWGKVPFSTRIAGTAIMICFILVLNSHLNQADGHTRLIYRLLPFVRTNKALPSAQESFLSPPINQARTPTAWLKMQDHDTAKELIQFVKPHSHSFVARVYEPLTIVIKGSDRGNLNSFYISFFNSFTKLASRHFFPMALVAAFSLASITLLMNYLLWNELPEEDSDQDNSSEPLLSIKTLTNAHSLDVVKLSATTKRHLVTISLDRSTALWLFDYHRRSFSKLILRTADLKPPFWPVVAAAIDEEGNILALCTDTGVVAFWNVMEQLFTRVISLGVEAFNPLLLTFVSLRNPEGERLGLVAITSDGRIHHVDYQSGQCRSVFIHNDHVVSACLHTSSNGQIKAIAAFSSGEVKMLELPIDEHLPQTLAHHSQADVAISRARHVLSIPALDLVLVARSRSVDLFDVHSLQPVHTFSVTQARTQSFRVLHSPRRYCHCRSVAVQSFSIVFTDSENKDCVMQTYKMSDSKNVICLRPVEERLKSCHGMYSSSETVYCLSKPGAWEATAHEAIIGVRKRVAAQSSSSSSCPSIPASTHTPGASQSVDSSPKPSSSGLKQRLNRPLTSIRIRPDTITSIHGGSENSDSFDSNYWEAWSLSSDGELYARPLFGSLSKIGNGTGPFESTFDFSTFDEGGEPPLFVSRPGPIARVGKRSVAVVLGNTVKLLTYGEPRLFEEDTEDFQDPVLVAAASRKRRVADKKAQ